MSKRTVKLFMVMLMLVTIALYFISGTYARYTSSASADATVKVAKWSVKVNDTDIDSIEESLDVTFTPDKSEDVVEGRIAPGITLTGEVEINLAGTEVAVDLDATVEETALQSALTGVGDRATVTSEIKAASDEGGATISDKTVKLQGNTALTDTTGKVKLIITISWTDGNDNGGTQDQADTALGIEGKDVTLPVTIKATQHISST